MQSERKWLYANKDHCNQTTGRPVGVFDQTGRERASQPVKHDYLVAT